MSLARTWKFQNTNTSNGEAKSLKNFVKYLPRNQYKKIWILNDRGKRRYYWVFSKKVCLKVVGTVTIVISKKRHNTKPEKAKILVTNIEDNIQAKEIVRLYTKRWYVECLFHELKSACGLGHQQVTKKTERVERAVAMSMMIYLLILRFEYGRLSEQKRWNILSLKA